MNDKQVAELFIEQHVLQPSQADDVLNEASLNGKTIAQAMVDSGFVDEHSFYQTIADALGTEYINLNEREIPASIIKMVPSGLARLHRALPILLIPSKKWDETSSSLPAPGSVKIRVNPWREKSSILRWCAPQ